jgi:hypothetical protein
LAKNTTLAEETGIAYTRNSRLKKSRKIQTFIAAFAEICGTHVNGPRNVPQARADEDPPQLKLF